MKLILLALVPVALAQFPGEGTWFTTGRGEPAPSDDRFVNSACNPYFHFFCGVQEGSTGQNPDSQAFPVKRTCFFPEKKHGGQSCSPEPGYNKNAAYHVSMLFAVGRSVGVF
ncbi:hypothetical protein IAQ61_010558 [Plenodomus lingam]|uniref:Predicted protein n=1 Tax=Leptosphaeria maculans (strain JN3 / isolate v23.1.3 / race Av1-4-5-6-7-8) TaxID=985895 RepID=E5A4D1_LEPMJ|nr:predicted protein [Plenodomus lingam JN3]KAH9862354.1 hypothetical protein IAQ61_010558 [Plenodomus lingam]CBX98476.1 predicted protein [Plenodomus lingam JN3]